MAYVVARPKGHWDIRESARTDSGPRSRTLATFRELDEDVLARAAGAAQRDFDRADVVRAAARAGAPIARRSADAAAACLLGDLAMGRRPSQALSDLLRKGLDSERSLPDIARWVTATAKERGEALSDVLRFVDALPDDRIRERPAPQRLLPSHE